MYLLLYALWILLNGRLTVEICLLGLVIVALVGLFAQKLLAYTPKTELRLLAKLPLFVVYLLVLVWEILKANFRVVGLILRPRTVDPALVTVEIDLRSEFARYVLANSITLTPGTITVKLEGKRFTVHCLREDLIDGIETGVFVRLLKKLEA